jgi:hypothetical protein
MGTLATTFGLIGCLPNAIDTCRIVAMFGTYL